MIVPNNTSKRSGWPWEAETEPDTNDQFIDWPKISVITPSFNQGIYLEETLRSVINQNYPNMEYFVVDGGSTDDSVEIIKKYEGFITKWVSEKDEGQSDAINKAFEWCTGDLVCWINSDDFFYPGSFHAIAKAYLSSNPSEISILSGNTIFIDKDSNPHAYSAKSSFPFNTPTDLTLIDHLKWFLPQPSMFFNRLKILQTGFFLRTDLHFAMDRELIYRLFKIGKLIMVEHDIASYRSHDESKTTGNTTFLDLYKETPKSFKTYFNGNRSEDKLRTKVMNWRMAQGYLLAARKKSKGFESIKFFITAACYRPNYLKVKFFWYSFIKGILGKPQ